jgi:PAS domain-containing protein
MTRQALLGRRAAGPLGLLVVAGVVALDAAWDEPDKVIVLSVALGPFLTAFLGTARATLAVAVAAVAAAILSGAWNDDAGDVEYVFRAAAVGTGGLIAVLAARSRERLARALTEVESLQAQMTAALSGLSEAVTMQDASGRLVYANDAAARALGFASPDELLATPAAAILARYRSFTADGAPLRVEDLPGRRVLAGLPADPLLLRVIDTTTGEERWRRTKAHAVHDRDGVPVLAVNVIEDVTDVKQAELAQREVAETLQASLLPDALPDIPGFEVASLYRPAAEDVVVGGDFYDSFRAGERWVLAVGDVTGRGAPAAALTAQARFTLRTATELLGDPVAAVAELNRRLVARPDLPLCTVALVVLDGDRASVLCADHPPPVLVRDGVAEAVPATGPLLGAWGDAVWTLRTLDLRPGDVLVLYTDGVIDAAGERERYGEARLAQALAGVAGAQDAIARIRDELRAFERGPQADDTAILALRRLPVAVPAG